MGRLSPFDVIIILALVALLIFVGSREFPLYGDRVFPAPSPTTSGQAS